MEQEPKNILHQMLIAKSVGKKEHIDILLQPEEQLNVGDVIYRKTNDRGEPILLTVEQILERRPSRGVWKIQPVKDLAKIIAVPVPVIQTA